MSQMPGQKSYPADAQPRASIHVTDGPPDDGLEQRAKALRRQRVGFLVTLAVGGAGVLVVGYLFASGVWHLPAGSAAADPIGPRPAFLTRAVLATVLAIVFSGPAFYVQALMMPNSKGARAVVQSFFAVVVLYFTFFAL